MGLLKPDPGCNEFARPVDGTPVTEGTVGGEKFDVVTAFCYLGDTLSYGEGCEPLQVCLE